MIVDAVRPVTTLSATNVGGQGVTNATIGVSTQYQTQVGPKSTRTVEIGKDFEICCSHMIPNHPGKCRRPHGHNYKLEVFMDGFIDPETGMVEDFDYLTDIVNKIIIETYDHRDLNHFFSLPTAEVLAIYWLELLNSINPKFCRLVVWETSKCRAIAYR